MISITVCVGAVFLIWYMRERRLGAPLALAWLACTFISGLLSLFSIELAAIVAGVCAADTLIVFSKRKDKRK